MVGQYAFASPQIDPIASHWVSVVIMALSLWILDIQLLIPQPAQANNKPSNPHIDQVMRKHSWWHDVNMNLEA